MDNLLVDLAYLATIGVPHKNLDPSQRTSQVFDKIISVVFNQYGTQVKDVPINVFDSQLIGLSDILQHQNCKPEPESEPEPEPESSLEFSRGLIPTEDNFNIRAIDDNLTNYQNDDRNIIIDKLKTSHELILNQYFAERDNVFNLTEECRNMRRILYDVGDLDEIQLLNHVNEDRTSKKFKLTISSILGEQKYCSN